MNTKAVVRPRKDPALIEYYVDGVTDRVPDELFTRIWMGIVPPDVEAGYACVVGELFDNSFEQRTRPKMVIDEGIALKPSDFDSDGLSQWSHLVYPAKPTPDFRERVERPTLDDLRQVSVALKDIYSASVREPILCFIPSGEGNRHFFQYMLQTWGFNYVGKRDDEEWKKWYPFFRSQNYRLGISNDPPFGDNPTYAHELVESLMAGGELRVEKHCDLFLTPELNNPRRCVGMVLAAMQMIDWSFKFEEYREMDGFGDWRVEEDTTNEQKLAQEIAGRLWLAGMRMPSVDDARKPYASISNHYLKEVKVNLEGA